MSRASLIPSFRKSRSTCSSPHSKSRRVFLAFNLSVMLFIFRSCVLRLQTLPRSASSARTLRHTDCDLACQMNCSQTLCQQLTVLDCIPLFTSKPGSSSTSSSSLHMGIRTCARRSSDVVELPHDTARIERAGIWFPKGRAPSSPTACVSTFTARFLDVQRLRVVLESLINCSSSSLQRH